MPEIGQTEIQHQFGVVLCFRIAKVELHGTARSDHIPAAAQGLVEEVRALAEVPLAGLELVEAHEQWRQATLRVERHTQDENLLPLIGRVVERHLVEVPRGR